MLTSTWDCLRQQVNSWKCFLLLQRLLTHFVFTTSKTRTHYNLFLSVFQFHIELFVSLPTYNTENSKQTFSVLYQNHFVLTKSRTQNSLSVFYQNHSVFIYLHITFRPSYFQFTINLKQIKSYCWTQ